jgi:hypothetical protein
MKALNLMEFVKLGSYQDMLNYYIKIQPEFIDIIEPYPTFNMRRNFECEMMKAYAGFLNKPFKPEMITELFEGWTVAHLEYVDVYTNALMTIAYNGCYEFNTTTKYRCLTNIRNLDEFITACGQAGIELEFIPTTKELRTP